MESTTSQGDFELMRVGGALRLVEGAGAYKGQDTLAAGTKAVTLSTIASTDKIWLSRATTGGTVGHLSYTISAGVGFTINSSSGTETSTVNYLVIKA
jgi:hypothetical protein